MREEEKKVLSTTEVLEGIYDREGDDAGNDQLSYNDIRSDFNS